MGAGRAKPAPHPPTLLPFRPGRYRWQVCPDKTCTKVLGDKGGPGELRSSPEGEDPADKDRQTSHPTSRYIR